ncbi:recombinase family protein [Halorubrum vacuolatum]|uniref:Site-specific DNA recombinase n=1 Tax=Halorubrum vacuolatum TaxID=63740 RepID=A0A238W8Q4_HALVU|nr:recombinase family protein [Halorubrum vacuolatum]SNR42975.1 Site-specific DNA recombinase [Halorubrum vacuolatum]
MFDRDQVRTRVAEQDDPDELRAAVYARTSSTSQKYGYSLDEQVSRCLSRCRLLGWDVLFVYRDGAESGKDTDRPMFKRMLSAAEKRVFDVIVFWKLDRFSRSLLHAVQLESELRQHGVYLYSVTEQIDTTSATGRFNFRNLASAAEFERDMIRQRTQIGLDALASEACWPNASAPLGYKIDNDGRLQIIEEEAELVRDIFEMYIKARSMPDVAADLNSRGIQTKQGGDWTPRAVGDVLRNEIYTGQYEVGEISKHVQEYQIIKTEIFEEVTAIRRRFVEDEDAKRSPMADSRKERAITRVREMYRDYREGSIGDSL